MTDECWDWESFKKKFKSDNTEEGQPSPIGSSASNKFKDGMSAGVKGLGGLTKFAGFGHDDDEAMEVTDITEIPGDWDVTTDILAEDECYKITLNIIRAYDVAAMDSNGLSDPFVEIAFGKDLSIKTRTISKTINPIWNEEFVLYLDDRSALANINVYDYDIFGSNDRIGYLDLDLACIPPYQRLSRIQDISSSVEGEDFVGKLEYSYLVEIVKISKATDIKSIGTKNAEKLLGIIQITVIEGIDLPPMNSDGTCDPYIRFALSQQNYETKVVQSTLNPKWRESFEFRYLSTSGNILQASIWDSEVGLSDNIIGEMEIDISKIPANKPFKYVLGLDNSSAKVNLLLKVLKFAELGAAELQLQKEINDAETKILTEQYSLVKTLQDIDNIGYIVVKLVRATNIPNKGLGTVDPYVVIELENCRCVSPVREDCLEPEWNLTYRFPVNDYHSILYLSLYDEDDFLDDELLGKMAIPLFNCHGLKRYILKNSKLTGVGNGELVLEATCFYNPIRAAIRTFAPKEEIILKDPSKFDYTLLQRDVKRITAQVEMLQDGAEGLDQIIRWRSKTTSVFSLIAFVLIVYYIELWMVPLVVALLLLWNYLNMRFGRGRFETYVQGFFSRPYYECGKDDGAIDEADMGIAERLNYLYDLAAVGQRSLDEIASLGEKFKNIGQWKNPFASCLLMVAMFGATIALYHIEVRWILLAWGINKFRKFGMDPNLIDNFEVEDFLSRVPSDPELELLKEPGRHMKRHAE